MRAHVETNVLTRHTRHYLRFVPSVQQSRAAGWRKPPGAVSVARPGPWGDPFDYRVLPGGRAEAVARYRARALVARVRTHLAGHDLMCWCPIGEPCHGDELLAVANDETGTS